MGYGFYWDPTYLIILPAIIFALYAQSKVKGTFSKYSKVHSSRNITAAEVARQILDENGLRYVAIEHISGNLTDHFDPRDNVVRLSDSVYGSTSVASIGVAAHEVGHAIQHAEGYFPIKVRNAIIPVTQLGSNLAFPLVVLGIIFSLLDFLIPVGIFLYFFVVLFQVVTLPVEFNASSRALKTLSDYNILDEEETSMSRSVLRAAAMTYIAAMATALLSLLRLIILAGRRRNN